MRRKGRSLIKEDVVAAAIHCLEQEGPDAVGINRVARELGIKPPSLYNHVSSNEDLRQSVALEGWRQLDARFKAVLQDGSENEGQLRRLSAAYRAFAKENPALYAFMASTHLEPGPESDAILESTLQAFFTVLEPLGYKGDEGVHAVRVLRSALHGFILLETGGQFGLPQSIDVTYDWMLSLLIRALIEGGESKPNRG